MHNRSMTKELILFSLPLILSGVLQQLYNWVDAFIIGHSGPDAQLLLAAVGTTGPITTLLLQCIIGFTSGLAILAGQELGQGHTDSVRRICSMFRSVITGVCILCTALVIAFSAPILRLMDTPDNILDHARVYLQIVLLGMPFLAVYNLYTALLRALGNTKVAFYSVVVSSLLNVVLDILFVLVLPFGIGGAAAATAISQMAMTIYIVLYARRRYPDSLRCLSQTSADPKTRKSGLSFGIPPTLRNSITSFGSIILQNFMNGFGTATVLAVTTAYRVDTIMLLPLFNMGSAISSLTARFHGEGDRNKIRQCMISGTMLIVLISLLLTFSMYFLGAAFIGFFGVTGEALQFGKVFFRDISLFYVPFVLAMALRCVLEGIGDLTFSSTIGIVSLLIRIAGSYLLRPVIGDRTIAYAEAISWIFMLVAIVIRTVQKKQELIPEKAIHADRCHNTD